MFTNGFITPIIIYHKNGSAEEQKLNSTHKYQMDVLKMSNNKTKQNINKIFEERNSDHDVNYTQYKFSK